MEAPVVKDIWYMPLISVAIRTKVKNNANSCGPTYKDILKKNLHLDIFLLSEKNVC